MKVKVISDSTCDLSDEILKRYDIDIVPFTVVLGEKECKDGVDIDTVSLLEYAKNAKELPKTTAANYGEFEEVFKKYLDGNTEIVYIGISSQLSCGFQNMKTVAEDLGNVYYLDGKSLSTGTGLLLIKACELAQDGKSAKEIIEALQPMVDKVQASFVVEKVDFLRKGGRCSMLASVGASLLKIKPSLILKDGKILSDKKFFGRHDEVMKKYVNYIFEKYPNYDDSRIFITHTPSNEEYVQVVRDLVKEKGFKEVIETTAGATISCHCGPNTIGILYLTK